MGFKIHFIGCEGVSMKTLRKICENRGIITTGSDLSLSGHDAANIDGADAVVYSAAISPDNPELVRAKQLDIPILSRAEMLGEVCTLYDFSVAVAGTHGKTTTTGMLWETLLHLDPTVHIGGNYSGRSERIGGNKLFITEACEYKRSFLALNPDIAIILNTDLDHTDCYKDINDTRQSYQEFAKKAKRLVVLNGDELAEEGDNNKTGKNSLGGKHKRCITVGLKKSNDYYPTCISPDKNGRYSFCVFCRGKRLGRISLNVAGRHNMLNALFTLAVCHNLGVSFGRISAGLSRFSGTKRRMESLGYVGGTAVFSDYAHHPTEIAMSLLSAKESCYKHITAVFEPHTYTRTQSFLPQFISALMAADKIIILPIFAAREKPIQGIDASLIAEGLKSGGKNAIYLPDYQQAKEYLDKDLKDDGVILFMGAGSIDKLARDFVKS